MVIDSTPTTDKQVNGPDTLQVNPQEHLTWYHKDPPNIHDPCIWIIFHIKLLLVVLTCPDIQ